MTIAIDIFCDPSAGADVNDGLSWATAIKTFGQCVTDTPEGGVCAIRAFNDMTSGLKTYDIGSTDSLKLRTQFYGVAEAFAGTTLADTDLLSAMDGDDMPHLGSTDNDIFLRGVYYFHGIYFDVGDDTFVEASGTSNFTNAQFKECHFNNGSGSASRKGVFLSDPTTENNTCRAQFHDCVFEGTDATDEFLFMLGFAVHCEVFGGKTLGALHNEVIANINAEGGHIEFRGFDFSSMHTAVEIINIQVMLGARILIANCKLPSTWTATIGSDPATSGKGDVILDIIQSDNGTHDAVFDMFERYAIDHVTVDEQTIKPAGDRSSLAMTPRADLGDQDTGFGAHSPWMALRVGAEATTITIPINNDGAGDLDDSEVYMEMFHPPTTGAAATSKYDRTHTFAGPGATAATVTDDTGTDWGVSDPGKGQKLAITKTFDYPGYVMCRVVFCQHSATPDTLYIGRAVKT